MFRGVVVVLQTYSTTSSIKHIQKHHAKELAEFLQLRYRYRYTKPRYQYQDWKSRICASLIKSLLNVSIITKCRRCHSVINLTSSDIGQKSWNCPDRRRLYLGRYQPFASNFTVSVAWCLQAPVKYFKDRKLHAAWQPPHWLATLVLLMFTLITYYLWCCALTVFFCIETCKEIINHPPIHKCSRKSTVTL